MLELTGQIGKTCVLLTRCWKTKIGHEHRPGDHTVQAKAITDNIQRSRLLTT